MVSEPTDHVELFTDGACSGNPGPGGWAFILKHEASGQTKKLSGSDPETTNNRMELMGVIQGLAILKRQCSVDLYTDSQYVAKGITEYMKGWKSRGWQRKEGQKLKPVKNVELWQRLDELLQNHEIRVHYVRGHSGHTENEECDRMAVAAYRVLTSS